MTASQDISFVCCIESGFLEAQTLLMAKSLRHFGGSFNGAPVFAVTPRTGPPISRKTIEQLDALQVTHLRPRIDSPYPWFKFLNKPLALVAAEPHISSSSVCWLDSDILFLGEPDKLRLQPGEDFVGFPVEDKEMGTTGRSDDPYEPLWRAFCQVLDIDIEQLPWVTTAETQERVRLYLNGGIFAYRRSSGFAQKYHQICLQLLDSGIGTRARGYNVGIKEMSAIGFAVVKMGLLWRALPYSHDYVVSSFTHDRWYSEELLRQARVAHYHDALWPKFWPIFLKCLQDTHPNVADWLTHIGPMRNDASVHWKVANRLLTRLRQRAESAYNQRCEPASV